MWPNPQETVDFVTFTEKIRDGKLQFFAQCSEIEEAANIILTLTILSNHFWTMFPFYTPCKHPKIFGFLVLSKGINWGNFGQKRVYGHAYENLRHCMEHKYWKTGTFNSNFIPSQVFAILDERSVTLSLFYKK